MKRALSIVAMIVTLAVLIPTTGVTQSSAGRGGASVTPKTLDIYAGFPIQSRQYRSFLGSPRRTFELRNATLNLAFHERDLADQEADPAARLARGEYHAAVLTASEAEALLPGAVLYSQPLLFCSYQEIVDIRSDFDEHLVRHLRNDPFQAFAIIGLDSIHFLADQPVASPDDLATHPVWVPKSLNRLRTWLASMAPDIRAFDVASPDEMPGWGEASAIYLNMPVGLILDSELPRPAYMSLDPATYTYFVVVVNRERIADLTARQQQEFGNYLVQVAARIDDFHARGAKRSRDMLEQGSGMTIVPLADRVAFAGAAAPAPLTSLAVELDARLAARRGSDGRCRAK